MNKAKVVILSNDFGKSKFEEKPARITRYQKWLLGIIILLFILMAFGPDHLWSGKNLKDSYGWPTRVNVLSLVMDLKIDLAWRYSPMGCDDSFLSPTYVALVKLFYLFIPYRLLCLRMVSVFATAVALFFLYRLAVLLFCRPVALIYVFLLVTSPLYVENFRAYGFIPLTNAVVAISAYLIAASFNNKKVIIKIVFLAFLCFSVLSLYIVGCLIVVFPILVFSFYSKRDWPKLLLFLLVFVLTILILDQALGDVRFSVKRMISLGDEWMFTTKQPFQSKLIEYTQRNLNRACYFLGLKYKRFYTESVDEWITINPLFNRLYTPFFFLGLIVCLWRRMKSNIFLLLWFFLFFLVPFASDCIIHRRIIFALNSIFLMIALGLWAGFRFVSQMLSSRRYPAVIASFSFIFLLGAGSWNLFEFFSQTSRPNYDYSRDQLKRLAIAIYEKGKDAEAIRYNRKTKELIWGNPYFDKQVIDMDIVQKLEFDAIVFNPRKKRPREIKKQIEYVKKEGRNILYIHTFPKVKPGGVVDDYWWHYDDIQWVKEKLADEVVVSQVPGIKEVYFVYVKGRTGP